MDDPERDTAMAKCGCPVNAEEADSKIYACPCGAHCKDKACVTEHRRRLKKLAKKFTEHKRRLTERKRRLKELAKK